jgi:heme A synthase
VPLAFSFPPTAGFLTFLALTVVWLGFVVWTGFTKRFPLHILFVLLALASLAGAIRFALSLGELYDLEAAGWITPFHLTLAKVTTALYLLPIATGIATWRDRRRRTWHRPAAFLVLGLTLLSTLTGAAMLLASPPMP